MLGMYIHTHWGYNRPYSARTWSDADWEGYLGALAALGFDFAMVWPQLDCMPAMPTPSDRAWLECLARAIDTAHGRFGMRIALTLCPNTLGNERAADFPFRSRPYFACERKINPSAPEEVAELLDARRTQLAFLAKADAIAIIDSDPGGYIGSTNNEFVALCEKQLGVMRELNPDVEFIYWMLAGWESYNAFWSRVAKSGRNAGHMWSDWKGDDFAETLELMAAQIPEPWSLFGWLPRHEEAIRKLGLKDKAMFYPYGVVEGEPAFPLTNCNPGRMMERFADYDRDRWPRGIMANAQTHCVQVPQTLMFAHFAHGGTEAALDLAQLGDRLLPGYGADLAGAWALLEAEDGPAQVTAAAGIRQLTGTTRASEELAGLLFGDVDRFLVDLAMNLELRAALLALRPAVDTGRGVRDALHTVLARLEPYQERTGFADAYSGPLRALLNDQLAKLGDPGVNRVLDQFSDWRRPEIRHGVVPRLLNAMRAYGEGA